MSESRQRWRLVFGRDQDARFLSHLDAVKLWERAFRRGSIPIATTEGLHPRPRLVFAAPLPLGMLAERELADLYLAERLSVADLRSRLQRDLPAGYRLIDLHDVWLGAPALAPQLIAADYRATLLGADATRLKEAANGLLASGRLDREKRREAKSIGYDLRPLLLELRIEPGQPESIPGTAAGTSVFADALGRSHGVAGSGAVAVGVAKASDETAGSIGAAASGGRALEPPVAGLWTRLRHSQELGSGRLEEVVAALAEESGLGGSPGADALELVQPVRERLWLGGELDL